jgi:hypothetical protein
MCPVPDTPPPKEGWVANQPSTTLNDERLTELLLIRSLPRPT